MNEGVNTGRECPWTRDQLLSIYRALDAYTKGLVLRLLQEEGESSAKEAFAAYNMFNYPVVYVFIHYHYGKFEDLGMKQSDIATYLTMYMMMTKDITEGILNGLRTSNVFYYDNTNRLSSLLEKVCEEVLYILED